MHRLGRPAVHYDWDARRPAALWVDSGDVVELDLPSGEDDQLGSDSTADDLARLDWSRLHALVGPIGVHGLLPGETLQIDLLDLLPASSGFVMHRPGVGVLDSPAPYLRVLDIDGGVARFGDIELRTSPMLGVVGVVPAESRASTRPPGLHGGNLDCSRLRRGASLLLPVFFEGGLASFGDPHALQGDGEVCVTGLECAMTAQVRLVRREDLAVSAPIIEDASALHFLGHGTNFELAATMALQSAVEWLQGRFDLEFPDAYALASLTVDLGVAQMVNRPIVGAMASVDKARFGIEGDLLRR